ncbi:nucleotidyl transferase AbiEii/AbiGii toxin family protein [Kosmotoga olearia]|uniref:Nucleotidyl transferase AbiEii/AbiGii toxin family protein n=1 Tax=Kosmotoga olearia (strain ATCC BAA-1733 / DSM 21960 / TBF 19.5.1) TaxID=521045 RepID=C5CDE5_KOSOT|nr:nucleotidyl transferase AbiEii/AbiGii toxin family protein [Kosmotoga olearia]ACR80008.1 Domain of unknown function DUF1814 [Kosmotoga olearia TBF 19.5.1]
MLSRETLQKLSEDTGYRPEILEKVLILLSWLDEAVKTPELKGKFVLKGGTALNLFLFDIPRLSVDIDLNFIGDPDRKSLNAERPGFEHFIESTFKTLELKIRNSRKTDAATSYSLRYESAMGTGGNLKVEINYQFRIPIFDPVIMDSKNIGSYRAQKVPILHPNELLASKIVAMLARKAARDFYDLYSLKNHIREIDWEKVKIAFVVYIGLNRKNLMEISEKDLVPDKKEIKKQLLPVLNKSKLKIPFDELINEIVSASKEIVRTVFPLKDNEEKFLSLLNNEGKIVPELLTQDTKLIQRINLQPQLIWKAKNVLLHNRHNS